MDPRHSNDAARATGPQQGDKLHRELLSVEIVPDNCHCPAGTSAVAQVQLCMQRLLFTYCLGPTLVCLSGGKLYILLHLLQGSMAFLTGGTRTNY